MACAVQLLSACTKGAARSSVVTFTSVSFSNNLRNASIDGMMGGGGKCSELDPKGKEVRRCVAVKADDELYRYRRG